MLYSRTLILVPEKGLKGLKRTERVRKDKEADIVAKLIVRHISGAGRTNADVTLCDEDVMTM